VPALCSRFAVAGGLDSWEGAMPRLAGPHALWLCDGHALAVRGESRAWGQWAEREDGGKWGGCLHLVEVQGDVSNVPSSRGVCREGAPNAQRQPRCRIPRIIGPPTTRKLSPNASIVPAREAGLAGERFCSQTLTGNVILCQEFSRKCIENETESDVESLRPARDKFSNDRPPGPGVILENSTDTGSVASPIRWGVVARWCRRQRTSVLAGLTTKDSIPSLSEQPQQYLRHSASNGAGAWAESTL